MAKKSSPGFIGGLGIIMDFKELKKLVQEKAIHLLDHRLILSKAYMSESKNGFSPTELRVLDFEPTAENLLLFLKENIQSHLPEEIQLKSLKFWETQDSYVAWSAD